MLITLAIIGIVSVLTIPTLVSNYKKKAAISQLKKAYSVIKNAIALSEVDNGEMHTWPADVYMDINLYFEQYLKPYLKSVELCNNTLSCGYSKDFDNKQWTNDKLDWLVVSDNSRILFKLADGTVIFWPRNTASADGTPFYSTAIYIDINGSLGPNKGGIDVFRLRKTSDKGLIPDPSNTCIETNASGCLNKILENGWIIPDDYPFKF